MYTDWIERRGRRGDELPAAGGAARFKPDQGVEARPLRATNAITNRKLEMVFECARASCGIVRHAALRSKPKATIPPARQRHRPAGPVYRTRALCQLPAARGAGAAGAGPRRRCHPRADCLPAASRAARSAGCG